MGTSRAFPTKNLLSATEFLIIYGCLAKYRCLSCEYEWEQQPEPTECSQCGGFYLDWVNHKEVLTAIKDSTK